MLRNIDRKRIYQEEIYRYKIRAQLDRTVQKKIKGKIWTFVNSAFFLWFLSSVVVGVISFLYVKWDKQRDLEREQRERAALVEQENVQSVRKLDAEISSRLAYFFYSQEITGTITEVRLIKEHGSDMADVSEVMEYYISINLTEDGIMSLYNPNVSGYKFGDPEYANRSLRSLLLELEAIVPPQEKYEISMALEESIKSQPMFIRIVRAIKVQEKEGKDNYIITADEGLNEFCKWVVLKRWGVVIPVETEIQERLIG